MEWKRSKYGCGTEGEKMGKNPGPSEWGQANGPEQGGHLPPMPQRPPRKPKRRLSLKAWLIIAGAVVMVGIIGNLLPDLPGPTGTAFPTPAPAPLTAAPSTPPVAQEKPTVIPTRRIVTATPTKAPTPTPTPTMNAREASNDWWFDRGGNQINSTISVLDRFAAAARAGDLADAQLNCSQLQDYASIWSPQSLLTLPDPDPAVGADLVQAFEDGRTGTQIAADKCAKFFEKNDQGALSQSIQFATAGSSELDKLQTGLLRLQGLTPPEDPNTAEVPQTPFDITEVPQTECLGANFRYEKIIGLSCDVAIAVLDRVRKTGTVEGDHNFETWDYHCDVASVGESLNGQADFTFRNKTSDRFSFEAFAK
jgi:hypothetical protein